MTDILPPAGWPNVRQLETNEFATGGANGNMNEQAKSLAARSELLKQYAALPYESKTGGYALNERVQLATGDIVRSTIPSNVNNPNENMTGWVKTNSTSQIFDESGKSQQEINDEFKNQNLTVVSPRDFGAPNNGVDDDAPAIRAAYEYLRSIGGGVLNLRTDLKWRLGSLGSTVVETTSYIIDIKSDDITLDFGSKFSGIETDINVDTLFYLSNGAKFIELNNGFIRGSGKAKYAFYSDKSRYNPYLRFNNTRFMGFLESAFSLNTFMSSFNNLNSSYTKRGFEFNNKATVAEITSVTMFSCYANVCSEAGFVANNRLMYSNLISCGADDCKVAYKIDGQGTNLISCGAERCEVYYESVAIQDGVKIMNPSMVQIGSTNPDTPVEEVFKVAGSGTITIDTPVILGSGTPVYRNNLLGLYKRSGTNSQVIITGNNLINKSNTKIVGTHAVVQPVIFYKENLYISNYTRNLTHSELVGFFDRQEYQDMLSTMTITLTGDDTDPFLRELKNVGGVGKIIIQGSSSDNTLTTLNVNKGNLLRLTNIRCPIEFKNLTIKTADDINDYGATMMTLNNCDLVYFNNTRFLTNGSCGSAFTATNGTRVVIGSATQVEGNFDVSKTFNATTGSTVDAEPRLSPPTNNRWYRGAFVTNAQPHTGTYKNIAGWRNTLGNTSTGWVSEYIERRTTSTIASAVSIPASGGQHAITVPFSNCEVGDIVDATYSLDLDGLLIQAQVVATGSIKVVFTNLKTTAVMLPVGIISLKIM